MSSPKPIALAAAGIAAVVLAFGAYTLGSSNSDEGTAGTASAAVAGQAPPGAAGNGQLPPNGQAPPGFGTPATGAAAHKAEAAALARYEGNAEQVMKLDDGSYVVHVIASNGEHHVTVSKDFKVTGADQGGPGAGGMPGSQRAAPPGAAGGSSDIKS